MYRVCAVLIFLWAFTCGAAPYDARVSMLQAETLLEELTEICHAVDERTYVVNMDYELVLDPRSGSPFSILEEAKEQAGNLSLHYIDLSEEVSGTYNVWFERSVTNRGRLEYENQFPFWTITNLTAFLGLPSDALEYTPVGGAELLESTDYGASACRLVLGVLTKTVSPPFIQQNRGVWCATNIHEAYSRSVVDTRDCMTGQCDVVYDVYEQGSPIGDMDCGLPLLVTKTNSNDGAASWSVSYTCEYSAFVEQMAANYSCLAGDSLHEDSSITSDERWDFEYTRRGVTGIALQFSSLKRDIACDLIPYAQFEYTSQPGRVVTNAVVVGCEDVVCDTYDEEGHVDGSVKCGASEVVELHAVTVPPWDPGLPLRFHDLGESFSKMSGTTNLGVTALAVPADPFADVQPQVMFDEQYSCDGISDPRGFGLWCFGVHGSSWSRIERTSEIQPREVRFRVVPVLMEVAFDYCR